MSLPYSLLFKDFALSSLAADDAAWETPASTDFPWANPMTAAASPVEILAGVGVLELSPPDERPEGAASDWDAAWLSNLSLAVAEPAQDVPAAFLGDRAWGQADPALFEREVLGKAGLLEAPPDIDQWQRADGWAVVIGSAILPDPGINIDWIGVFPTPPTVL